MDLDDWKCMLFTSNVEDDEVQRACIKHMEANELAIAKNESTEKVKLKDLLELTSRIKSRNADLAIINRSQPVFSTYAFKAQGKQDKEDLEEPMARATTHSLPDCLSCGSNQHKREECKFKRAQCNYCTKPGHIAKVCRAKQRDEATINSKPIRNNYVEILRFDVDNPDIAPQMLEARVNDHSINFLVDTGAQESLLTANTWRRIGEPKLEQTNQQGIGVSGQPFNFMGTCKLAAQIGNHSHQMHVFVTDQVQQDIMAKPTLNAIGLGKVIQEFLHTLKSTKQRSTSSVDRKDLHKTNFVRRTQYSFSQPSSYQQRTARQVSTHQGACTNIDIGHSVQFKLYQGGKEKWHRGIIIEHHGNSNFIIKYDGQKYCKRYANQLRKIQQTDDYDDEAFSKASQNSRTPAKLVKDPETASKGNSTTVQPESVKGPTTPARDNSTREASPVQTSEPELRRSQRTRRPATQLIMDPKAKRYKYEPVASFGEGRC